MSTRYAPCLLAVDHKDIAFPNECSKSAGQVREAELQTYIENGRAYWSFRKGTYPYPCDEVCYVPHCRPDNLLSTKMAILERKNPDGYDSHCYARSTPR